MLKTFFKFNCNDLDLSRVQDNISNALTPVLTNPLLDGHFITLAVTALGVSIDHKLGRIPQGWILIDKDANINVWKSAIGINTITFTSDGPGNIKILIF